MSSLCITFSFIQLIRFCVDNARVFHCPVPKGGLVVLTSANKALSPSKLKYETLYINGVFINFQCQAPLHKHKGTY